MLPPCFPDLYAVLGLTFNASPSGERIRRAYLRRCRRVHPDKGGFHDSFLKFKHAYDVLSDPNRRAEYDGRYELQQIRDAAMSEYGSTTTAFLRPSPSLTPTATSRSRASAMSIPDLSQPHPLNHSQLPTAFHPDPIAEAYRRGMPPYDPQAVRHHAQLLGDMDRDSFEPHVAGFLNLAAYDGLRLYHDPDFQEGVAQRCREIGREVMPVTRAEAEKGVDDALRGWEELRSGLLFVVVLHARPHLLYPHHPFMRETYRVVAVLGYFGESLRRLKEEIVRIGGEGERRPLDDPLLSGALKAHHDTGRDMVEILERLKCLAEELATVRNGDPKRDILLQWMCGEMRNWPRVSDEI